MSITRDQSNLSEKKILQKCRIFKNLQKFSVLMNSASGILIYRLISIRSERAYWIQSSCRMFYKNGKPEAIGLTHRLLT